MKRLLLVVATALTVALLVAADVGGVRAHLSAGTGPEESSSAVGSAPVDDGDGDVDGLTPQMASALERAQESARADGVELLVNSGWRSEAHQQQLYDEAIDKYGSPEAARRWVLPPNESAHVQGGAVDVGPPSAASWLERHGEQWGLCRVYDNEPWHFERLAGAIGSSCPALLPHP